MSIVKGIKFKKEFRGFPKGTKIDFNEGNFIVILGDNGSGKTTLLQAIGNAFKKESFFDRKDESLEKSCDIILKEGIDPKKSMSILLDYLHDNPKNASHLSEDYDTVMIELQSQWASSGQATQLGLSNKMAKFLTNSTDVPSIILFDQPETSLDVGSMTQICFILMMRLVQENKQLFVATHSSDWLKAMHLAFFAIGEDIQKRLSLRFIDLTYPSIKIESMEQAVIHNNNKQVEALNRYIQRLSDIAEEDEKERVRAKKTKAKATQKAININKKPPKKGNRTPKELKQSR